MHRPVDFDDVIKDFALASQEKEIFELCSALQLQICATYALDCYLCKTVFLFLD